MHHGKNRGNEKHIKYVKTLKFAENSGGKFLKVWGKNNFVEIVGGEMY